MFVLLANKTCILVFNCKHLLLFGLLINLETFPKTKNIEGVFGQACRVSGRSLVKRGKVAQGELNLKAQKPLKIV